MIWGGWVLLPGWIVSGHLIKNTDSGVRECEGWRMSIVGLQSVWTVRGVGIEVAQLEPAYWSDLRQGNPL
jgi:hypothetical protein